MKVYELIQKLELYDTHVDVYFEQDNGAEIEVDEVEAVHI